MDYVNQDYWDKSYNNLSLEFNVVNDPISKLLKNLIAPTKNGEVFEIGCFPGRYLKEFGDQGYILNGIDTTYRVKDDLPKYLKEINYKVGDFICGDIFKEKTSKKYDVVCSFGFIEHFINWEKVLAIHFELVKAGGIVIITVPNFKGLIPNLFHKIFDRINLRRHNIKAMDVAKWKKCINELSIDYEILYEGPFGEFDLWVDNERRSKIKVFMQEKIFQSIKYIRKLRLPESNIYSPYIGLIIEIK